MGVFRGVTGVVTRPVDGMKEGGGKGFALGLIQGTLGLVVRPLAGAVGGVTRVRRSVWLPPPAHC